MTAELHDEVLLLTTFAAQPTSALVNSAAGAGAALTQGFSIGLIDHAINQSVALNHRKLKLTTKQHYPQTSKPAKLVPCHPVPRLVAGRSRLTRPAVGTRASTLRTESGSAARWGGRQTDP